MFSPLHKRLILQDANGILIKSSNIIRHLHRSDLKGESSVKQFIVAQLAEMTYAMQEHCRTNRQEFHCKFMRN